MSKTGVMIRPPYLAEQPIQIHREGQVAKEIADGAVVVRARGKKYAALTRKGVEAVHETAEDIAAAAAGTGAKGNTLAAGLVAAPESLADLHTLAEKEKDKTSYKYAEGARESLTDAVQIREGIADFTVKKARPIQAIVDPSPVEPKATSEGEQQHDK
jgi:hypothetical protein